MIETTTEGIPMIFFKKAVSSGNNVTVQDSSVTSLPATALVHGSICTESP